MTDAEDAFADLPTGTPIAVRRARREPTAVLLRIAVCVAILQTLCSLALDNIFSSIAPAPGGFANVALWLYVPTAIADAALSIACLASGRKSYRAFAIVALVLVLLQFGLVLYAIVRFVTGPAPWDF